MKKMLKTIWIFISALWTKIDKFIETITPIAIKVVNEIKKVNESTSGDILETIISTVIPGTVDDKVINMVRKKLKIILPRILSGLNLSQAIAQIQDPNEQLKAIIVAINMSPDEAKNAYYHGLSVLIINSLADGKLTWSESVQIAEYYYRNIHKK